MEIRNLDELKELIRMLEESVKLSNQRQNLIRDFVMCNIKDLAKGFTTPSEVKIVPDYMSLIWYYLGRGMKVNAIRIMKSETGLGLKEAKEKIDEMVEKIHKMAEDERSFHLDKYRRFSTREL